jgi:hypothetical protein
MKTDYEKHCDFVASLNRQSHFESDSTFFFTGNTALTNAEAFVRGEGYEVATQESLALVGDARVWFACAQGNTGHRDQAKVDCEGLGRVRFLHGHWRLLGENARKNYYRIDVDGRMEGKFIGHFYVRPLGPGRPGRKARAEALGGKPQGYTISTIATPWAAKAVTR